MARAVEAVAHTPLSPDPVLWSWRRLARTALSCPASPPLRDHLRHQPVVPPGWCYALGLMELSTGNPARARGAAKALEASHAAWPEDTESLWLASLLRCRLGDRERAIDDISRLLGHVDAGTPVWLAGDESGPQPLEQHLVRALLDLGDPDSAAELARATTAPLLRARLLREVGAMFVLDGDRGTAAILAEEAVQAREEARETDTPPSPLDAALPALIRLLADEAKVRWPRIPSDARRRACEPRSHWHCPSSSSSPPCLPHPPSQRRSMRPRAAIDRLEDPEAVRPCCAPGPTDQRLGTIGRPRALTVTRQTRPLPRTTRPRRSGALRAEGQSQRPGSATPSSTLKTSIPGPM